MTALTMTLLPEPVAPAIRRWGIFARSTAWALPATSRPRANVSFDSVGLNGTSSKIRRRATTLKSWFGISMPIGALAGDRRLDPEAAGGEGHRQVVGEGLDPRDADVDRGLDLVLGHDRAGVAADDLGGDPEARELPDDDLLVALVDGLAAARLDRGGDVLEQLERWQAVLDPLLRRRRVAGVGHVVERPHRSRRIRDQRRGGGEPFAARAPGERRRGRERAGNRRRDPRLVARLAAPDPGLAGRRGRARDGLRAGRAGDRGALLAGAVAVAVRGRRRPARSDRLRLAPHRGRGRAADPLRGPGDRLHDLPQAEVEREHQPDDADCQQDDERARAREQRLEDARLESADPAAAALRPHQRQVEDLERAEEADVGDPDPEQRHAPAGAGPLAGTPLDVPAGTEQEERQEPAAGLEPRRDRVAPPVGQCALAGQRERDQRDRAQHEQDDPDDRAGDLGVDVQPVPAAARGAPWSSGGVSPSDLDHDREDHRPALRLLVQVARHAVLDLALQQPDLADVVARVPDGLEDLLRSPRP